MCGPRRTQHGAPERYLNSASNADTVASVWVIIRDITAEKRSALASNVPLGISTATSTAKDLDDLFEKIHQQLSRLMDTSNLGSQVIVTGSTPDVAQILVQFNIDLSEVKTCGSLRVGVGEAVPMIGR